MSKKRIIRKSIAGVLALTMMAPAVLPSGEFVMNILDSGIMRAAAESHQKKSKILNNGCPWFEKGFLGVTFGDTVDFKVDLKSSAKSVKVLTGDVKDGAYTQAGEAVEVSDDLEISVPVTIEQNKWYKIEITFDDDTVELTEPITFYLGETVDSYNDDSLYISNGKMAYTLLSYDCKTISFNPNNIEDWTDDKYKYFNILVSDTENGDYYSSDDYIEVYKDDISDSDDVCSTVLQYIPENYWFKLSDGTNMSEPIFNDSTLTSKDISFSGITFSFGTTTGCCFDVKGNVDGNWIKTSYSDSWEIFSSKNQTPNPEKGYASSCDLKKLKFNFDKKNPVIVNVEAYLGENEKSFGFGCDVMIGSNDDAPVTIVKNKKGNVAQAQLVDTNGELADISAGMNALVINTSKKSPDKYWVGYWSSRMVYDFNNSDDSCCQFDESGYSYQCQGEDSGMTLSWTDLPEGSVIPFSFGVGTVEETGASNSAVMSEGSAISSTEIEIEEAYKENWYRIQKKDGEELTDIKIKYDEDEEYYYPSEDGEVWFHPEYDGVLYIGDLVPETNYVVSVLSDDDMKLFNEDENEVEPDSASVNTFIDPYESVEEDKPVTFTSTGSTIRVENLRDGYKYALKNSTEYITPVNGVVEFNNLNGATTYNLVAVSVENEEIKSDSIEIHTKIDVTFIDTDNNYSKVFVLDEASSLNEADFNMMMEYSPDGDEIRELGGWYSYDNEMDLNETKEYKYYENITYYAYGMYPLSKLQNPDNGCQGMSIDLDTSLVINDTNIARDIIVYSNGCETSYSIDPSESLGDIIDYYSSVVYLGQKNNTDYFALASNQSEIIMNSKSEEYINNKMYLSADFVDLIKKGHSVFDDRIYGFDYNHQGYIRNNLGYYEYEIYGIGDNVVIVPLADETDNEGTSRTVLQSICDWSVVNKDDTIVISGEKLPFDALMTESSNYYQYTKDNEVVRDSKVIKSYRGNYYYIRFDNVYDGNEMILNSCLNVEFYDKNYNLLKAAGATLGKSLSESVFEEVNRKYSGDDSFIGWYSWYEGNIVSESRVIEFNDYYYPAFGIAASKYDDNAIGKILKPTKSNYSYLYNDTDAEITIWVDGVAYNLEPNECYSYNYSSSFISSISNGLYFAGSKDNNYYFASILPNSILSEGNDVIIENDGKKYLNVCDENEISLVGLGDSFIEIYSDYNIDYQDALFSLKTKTWSYQKTYNGSGIIEGTNLPFDGLISDSQINIIDNNEIVDSSDKITITAEDVSYECNVILLDKNNPDPVVFRKVVTGLDISQVEGIMEVGHVEGNPYYNSAEGVIEVTSGDKFIIYAAEEIDFDEIFGGIASVLSKHVKTGDDKGYYYTIEITDDVDPDATYYATHKHDYSYITDTNGTGADDAETATLRYKCNSEEGSDYVTIARLGLGSTLYYGDSLVPKVELLPENLNLGEKIAKGSVTYKAGDNVSSAAPTDFGVYNVAAEIVMTNLDDTITKYSLSKNISYEKRPLSECKVVVSQETYDGTEKIPASIKVINPANNEELVLNKDYVIDPITPKKEAGTYQDGIVLHAVADSENYTGDYGVTWSINKADLPDFSINALDRYTYGSGYEIGVSSLPEDADGEVTYKYSYDGEEDWFDEEPKDVGTYYVKAEYSNDNNYNDAETDVFSYTIEKKNIVVTPVAAEMTYGDAVLPLITCTISEIPDILEGNEPSAEELATLVEVKGFSVDGTAEGTSNNAGKYNIGLINGVEDAFDNYTFVLDSTPVYMTVKPRKITANMFKLLSEDFTNNSYNFEYDGKRKKVEYAINANDEDGNYHVANTYAVLTPDDFEQGGTVYATKAGAYKVEFIGNNELYGEGNWCDFQTVEWNISKRNVNVKIQAANGAEADKEYDGTPVAFEVVSTDPAKPLSDAATVTYSYFEITDGEEGEEIEAPTAAGSYRVKATVNDENTSIPEGISLDYVIKAKDVTVNIDASTTTKVYGDETPDICYTFDGIIDADKEKYASDTTGNVTADLTSENVGSYGLTSDFTDKNYNFTLSKSTFEITRREILESDVAISSNKVFIPDSGWTNPTVTVTSNGNTLKMDEDFICSGTFKTRIKGEKSFLVEGTGNYKGEVEVNWTAVSLDDLSIQMTNAEPVYADGNYKVKYRFEMPELPEGLTVVKYGALYNKNGSLEENAKIEDNSILRTTKTTAYPSSYSLTINNNNDMSARSSAKCYAVVTDGENEYVIYSNVVGACYKDKVAAYCGSITAEPTGIAKVDNQYKVSFKFDFEIPENFTVTEYGALYNKNGVIGEDLTYETAANKTSKAATSKINSYTLTVNEKSAVDAVASARCYAKVTDGTNEYIIYSGVVSDSFSAAAQREAEEKCSVTGTCVTEVKPTTSKPYKENFTFNLNAGEGYTITARGALYDRENVLTGNEKVKPDSDNVTRKEGSETTYTLAMGYLNKNEATGSAMGYMEVTDSYELKHIIYSDPVDCVQFDN